MKKTATTAGSGQQIRVGLSLPATDRQRLLELPLLRPHLIPVGTEKRPIGSGWQKPDRSYSDVELAESPAIGLRLGYPVLAVDFDPKPDNLSQAERTFEQRTGRSSAELPISWTVTSGKPGRRQVLLQVDPAAVPWLKPWSRDGLELRWRGQQSVIHGHHPETGRYTWLPGRAPWECELAAAPLWLLQSLQAGHTDQTAQLWTGELPPRSEADLLRALERVPEFFHKQGRRDELLGLAQRLTVEWGADRAHSWLAQHSPTVKDLAGYFTSEPNRIKRGWIWPFLHEHYGVSLKRDDLKRSASAPQPAEKDAAEIAKPYTGKAIRLKPHEVLELLPQRIGTPRLNVRSGEVHTARGVLDANEASRLYLELSGNGETWPKETTSDAVAFLANQNRFDPVARYLDTNGAAPLPMQQWQRLDHHLLGIDDPIAAEFLPRYFISAVARVFEPGADVRQNPVLVGPQWRGKTALGRILFGAEHWLSGVGDLGKDALMRLHTAWGVELAELDGITRRADQEALKAFLTETVDAIRRPYDVATVKHPRKFVFWGTSNGAALRDATGNTRYVTIPIPDRMLPLDWAHEHRNSLWARAVEQYKAGVLWNQCDDETRDAIADRNANYTEQDPWRDCIAQVLMRKEMELQLPVQIADLLAAVQVPIDRQRGADGQRVRQVAESLGWVMDRRRVGDDRRRGLWPPERPQGHKSGHNPGHKPEASQANGSTTAGHKATTKPEKLEKEEVGHGVNSEEACEGSFGPDLVDLVPTPQEVSDSSGSDGGQPYGQTCGHLVARPCKTTPSNPPAFVGSGADAFDDDDDPHWPKRPEVA